MIIKFSLPLFNWFICVPNSILNREKKQRLMYLKKTTGLQSYFLFLIDSLIKSEWRLISINCAANCK